VKDFFFLPEANLKQQAHASSASANVQNRAAMESEFERRAKATLLH